MKYHQKNHNWYQHKMILICISSVLHFQIPVSYTHLDVYKRQVEVLLVRKLHPNLDLIHIIFPRDDDFVVRPDAGNAEQGGFDLRGEHVHAADDAQIVRPVSYTHLSIATQNARPMPFWTNSPGLVGTQGKTNRQTQISG